MIGTVAIRLTFSIVLMIFGLYMLMCGIRRKGMIYSNPALHEKKYYDKYVGIVRAFCFILPAVFLLNLVISLISYSMENSLTNFVLTNDIQSYNANLDSTKRIYNIASVSLIVSVATIIIMIFTAMLVTSIHSNDKDREKLSGDHPAFKK